MLAKTLRKKLWMITANITLILGMAMYSNCGTVTPDKENRAGISSDLGASNGSVALIDNGEEICLQEEVTEVPFAACMALIDLYNSTNGDNWTNNSNWGQIGTSIDSWFGISTFNNRIEMVSLSSNNLDGTLPASIGETDISRQLRLDNNDLVGQIPTSIGDLSDLDTLDLSYNNLTGVIPTSVSGMASLNILDLKHNNLTGSIPVGITSIPDLYTIRLSHNKLTGTVPISIGDMNGMWIVDLSNNRLSGEIISAHMPSFMNMLYGTFLSFTQNCFTDLDDETSDYLDELYVSYAVFYPQKNSDDCSTVKKMSKHHDVLGF